VKRRRSERRVQSRRWLSSVERSTVACGSVAVSYATTATLVVSPTSWRTWTPSAPADERAASASRTRCSTAPIRARKTSRPTYSSATTACQVRLYTSSWTQSINQSIDTINTVWYDTRFNKIHIHDHRDAAKQKLPMWHERERLTESVIFSRLHRNLIFLSLESVWQ